jgi:hypothetical protein
MLFDLVQTIYWLALATWFGGVLFIALAAPIIFRTVRDNNPILPTVLSVNLEGQHGTLLAGSIVANLLAALQRIELACAGGLFVAILGQWLVLRPTGGRELLFAILRTALYLAAVAIVVYDWRFVWPRISEHRREYIEHADEPDVANAAKDQFDRYHRESVTLLSVVLFLLLGMVLFSARISAARVIFSAT